MDLYTSLVRLKQEMNGGVLPAMTPVTGAALKLIDPEFTIGLGALREDPERGLQCPIRGCGVYRHALGVHVTRVHKTVGVAGIRRALSIPSTAPLASMKMRERLSANNFAQFGGRESERFGGKGRGSHREDWTTERRRKESRTRSKAANTVGVRNLTNTCMAQLTHRILDLSNKLGRSPSFDEANQEFGRGIGARIIKTFGTWSSALAQCGLKTRGGASQKGKRTGPRPELRWYTQEAILEALSAWYAVHGELPSGYQVQKGSKIPYLPHRKTILQHFPGAKNWYEAMERAATLLGIYGGSYGIPEHLRPKEESAA